MSQPTKRLSNVLWHRTWEFTDRKPCTSCKEVKLLEEFQRMASGFLGRASICEPCWKPRKRRGQVLRLYGEEGVEILDRIEAGEPCEACGEAITNMDIDHNHKTGKTRGLLCHFCNKALGMLKDDEARILGLLKYWRKYEATSTSD